MYITRKIVWWAPTRVEAWIIQITNYFCYKPENDIELDNLIWNSLMVASSDKSNNILLLILDKDAGFEIDYKLSLNYISCLLMVALFWYYVWKKSQTMMPSIKLIQNWITWGLFQSHLLPPFSYRTYVEKNTKIKWYFLQIILVDSYTISIHPDKE